MPPPCPHHGERVAPARGVRAPGAGGVTKGRRREGETDDDRHRIAPGEGGGAGARPRRGPGSGGVRARRVADRRRTAADVRGAARDDRRGVGDPGGRRRAPGSRDGTRLRHRAVRGLCARHGRDRPVVRTDGPGTGDRHRQPCGRRPARCDPGRTRPPDRGVGTVLSGAPGRVECVGRRHHRHQRRWHARRPARRHPAPCAHLRPLAPRGHRGRTAPRLAHPHRRRHRPGPAARRRCGHRLPGPAGAVPGGRRQRHVHPLGAVDPRARGARHHHRDLRPRCVRGPGPGSPAAGRR